MLLCVNRSIDHSCSSVLIRAAMKFRKLHGSHFLWLVALLGAAAENEKEVLKTGPRIVRRLNNAASKNALLVTSEVEILKMEKLKTPTVETTTPAQEVPMEVGTSPTEIPENVENYETSKNPAFKNLETTSAARTTEVPEESLAQYVSQAPSLWPNRTIVYKINATGFSGDQLKQLRKAFKTLEARTGCLKTRPADSRDLDFVEFLYINKSRFRCETTWGYHKGRQEFKVHKACFSQGLRWIMLEMLRLFGFPYEHQRADRDQFVRINFDNIKEGGQKYFAKLRPTAYFNLPYNFESFLHFDTLGSGWAKNKSLPVITTFDPRLQDKIGRSEELNSGDIRKIRIVYGCDPPPEGARGNFQSS